ncbi:MAG: peptidase S8, partial [Flavisolibacter sp.]
MMNILKRPLLAMAMSAIGLTSFGQTSVKDEIPNGWHLKDKQTTGLYGISLDKAYSFLKGKKSQTIIVAVIDSGIDTLHEDLKPILWTNPKEIPGNGIDDDGNGYVDDIHGWNFIGGRDGRNVKENSSEVARVYHGYKARFENVKDSSNWTKEDHELYKMWLRAKEEVTNG